MKSQIEQKGQRYEFVELLIPTLNKIISYQFLLLLLERANHEQSSKIISVHVVLQPNVWGTFFEKKLFHSNSEG